MATLLQFSKNMRSRASQVRNAPPRIIRRAAFAALKVAASGTPVDEGVARSNWRLSIGARTFKVIPAHSPGKNLGIDERANLNATLAAGRNVLRSLVRGQAVILTNNADHIDDLNQGSSGQSSGGFVEAAGAAARLVIASTRIFVRVRGPGGGFEEDLI